MAKVLDPYDYKEQGELVVTVTLAEYRSLLQFRYLHQADIDGLNAQLDDAEEYIGALKAEVSRLGGTVPVRYDNIQGAE